MKVPRSPLLAGGGLALLLAGLFVSIYVLNRNQYTTNLGNLDARLETSLKHFAQGYREDIERQEKQLCGLAGSGRTLEADLFVVGENFVVPACQSNLLATIPKAAADAAYKRGISKLPEKDAYPHFAQAAKMEAETPDDLYRKLCAHFNLLELDYNVQTVCCILSLLDSTGIKPTPAQTSFFQSMLRELVPNLEPIEARLAELEALATKIDQQLNRQKGAYRVDFEGRTLSVKSNGLALLYTPELERIHPYQVAATPQRLHREIVPGLFLSIPDEYAAEHRRRLLRDYRSDNAILALMALLGGVLVYGLFASSVRQRKLDAMRTEFISTVSHELRTPLSLIRLHAETLKHGRVPAGKVGDYHQTILTEAERLTGIVNNVLDFSRMERGKLQIHPEEANLSELTEQAASAFNDRFAREGFTLERNIKPDMLGTVDPLAYSQIVFNLLDNAIKYSDGEKTIRIGLDDRDGCNILTVADQGIGIPGKLKKHIFEEFVRSGDRKVTARRGSGIGLSVAKRLAEQMGGTIAVADNEPKGTVFTVRLNVLRRCDAPIAFPHARIPQHKR